MQIDPTDLFEDAGARFSAELGHRKKEQVDAAAARVIVLVAGKFSPYRGAYAQLLPEFANERFVGSLAVLYLAAWEFPFQRMPVAFSPLPDKNPALAVNDAGRDK